MNLSQHPLLMQAYELSVEVDKLPACVEQTALITKLGIWRDALADHLEAKGLLDAWAPPATSPNTTNTQEK